MKSLYLSFLSLLMVTSSLQAAEKIAVEVTKFALKPAMMSLAKNLYSNSKLALSITYKATFAHELSHLLMASALSSEIDEFTVGPLDGHIIRSSHGLNIKDASIAAAGPLGGLSYMSYLTYKHALNKKIPFGFLIFGLTNQLQSLLPKETDGKQMMICLKGISIEQKREYLKNEVDAQLLKQSQYVHLGCLSAGLLLAKKTGHTLFGKPGLKLLPIIAPMVCLGPVFNIKKDESNVLQFSYSKSNFIDDFAKGFKKVFEQKQQ